MKNNNRLNSFQELNSLRSKITAAKSKSNKTSFPNTLLLKDDGEDHINMWDAAETELGKVLNHSYKLEFHHSVFGKFISIETFWSYVRSIERDDQIRSLSGRPLREFINNKINTCQVTNFKAIIMDTHWQRIKCSQPLMEEIKNSTLRFDCYYIHAESGQKIRPPMFKWVCLGLEEIRKALKEDREPDFKFLLDDKSSQIYDFVNDHILKKENNVTTDSPEEKQTT